MPVRCFCDYVHEAEANGVENYHLYDWTKKTIEDPAKKAKYTNSFALYVGGDEVYAKGKADALEAELKPLLADRSSRRCSNTTPIPPTTRSPRSGADLVRRAPSLPAKRGITRRATRATLPAFAGRELRQATGASSIMLTWAATMCQPSSKRTQVCICRPSLPGMLGR